MSKKRKRRRKPSTLWVFYNHFNKTCFGNKLLLPRVLKFAKQDEDGLTSWRFTGEVEITIHEDLRNHLDLAAVVLLHEMAHVSMGYDYSGDHGMRFEAEMVRLFMAGAYDKIL